jgi:hypothetical protein
MGLEISFLTDRKGAGTGARWVSDSQIIPMDSGGHETRADAMSQDDILQ